MSKRARHARKSTPDPTSETSAPMWRWPWQSLHNLMQEIGEAEKQFEQFRQENQNLKEQVSRQAQELDEGLSRQADLKAQCESLRHQIVQLQEDVKHSHSNALYDLFADMSSEQQNYLLRKLLAYDQEQPRLLTDLGRYFKEKCALLLEGEVGAEITLTEENLNRYELKEAVALPARARIIGRGVSFEGRMVLRAQAEYVGEVTSDGH